MFKGLCENRYEDCIRLIRQFLELELELDPSNICIDRAHRIGQRNMRGISRRPIIVAFRDFQDTVLIMDMARLLRGKQYGLDRDYPAEISKARQLLWNRYKELKSAKEDVALEYPARLVIGGKRVVEDAFPGWYEVLKGKRIQPVISESVEAANVRAEQRRRNNVNGSLISSERATTSTYATTTMSNTHNTIRPESNGMNGRAGNSVDYDHVDEEDAASYSNYVSILNISEQRRPETWGIVESRPSQSHLSLRDYPMLPPNNSNKDITVGEGVNKQLQPPNSEQGHSKVVSRSDRLVQGENQGDGATANGATSNSGARAAQAKGSEQGRRDIDQRLQNTGNVSNGDNQSKQTAQTNANLHEASANKPDVQ